ncbi:MAG: hypothetical protein CTY38_01160 [Methylotenera sp.]|uniref:A1S_2505 family phage non-structural protein n=1 Tax=Methylotenera sp. TaxID=2051956 RepID=UPI000D410E27|nr:hypothetical protein [Methylotenera sp.]PPC84685.1 MAG: hypothetical protein CTY38_01160 [Methylotenera sp.]
MKYQFHQDRTLPINNEVFVFGSNTAGRHGAGAALVAKQQFGAVYGQGVGYMANKFTGRASYAIPTKGEDSKGRLFTLLLPEIKLEVNQFIQFAADHPQMRFFMTRIGCELAGYKDSDIAPMFMDAPDNIQFPEQWKGILRAKVGVGFRM